MLGEADRGQSVVIGAVILFGFLVIGLSTYQATVIPAQNQQIEFDHELTVRDDMVGVRDAIARAGTSGDTVTAEVKLGATFPSRTLFVNPPPAVGRLETGTAGNVSVNVSEATFLADVPSEVNETREFWTATGNFTTKPVVYSPTYRSYGGGPENITVDLSHAYAQYDDGGMINLTRSPLVVANGQVTLVLVKGNLSEAGVQTVSVSASPVSTVSRRETVSNFNISVPTSLSAAEFRGLLAESSGVDESNVTVTPNATTPGRLDVRFAGTYEFAVAVVSVGQHDETREAASVDFVSVEENVTAGESARVVVEVRDQYGNPMSGVRVDANATGWEPAPRNTTSDGRVTFEFNSTGHGGETVQLNFTTERLTDEELSALDAGTPTNATANVSVSAPSGGGGGGGTTFVGSSSSPYNTSWQGPLTDSQNGAGVTYYPGNNTLLIDGDQASDAVELTTLTDNDTLGPISGVSLDFATNNSSVVDLPTDDGVSDADGYGNISVAPLANGSTRLFVSTAQSSDSLRVKTVDIGKSGVYYRYYESTSYSGSGMPTFQSSDRVDEGIVDTFTLDPAQRGDHFGFVYTAKLVVPTDGYYKFRTRSDDGSRLYIDGVEIIDNGGEHSATNVTNDTFLTAGTHDINVTYFEDGGQAVLGVYWNESGSMRQIPKSALRPRLPLSVQDPNPGVVYRVGSTLKSVDSKGRIATYDPTQPKVLGPMSADLDGDGLKEIPYLSNGDEIEIVDLNNQTQTIVTAAELDSVKNSDTRFGVGDLDGDGNASVFYVDDGEIHRIEPDGDNNTVEVVNSSKSGKPVSGDAIAGVANFGGGRSLVFLDGKKLEYAPYDGSTELVEEPQQIENKVKQGSVGSPGQLDGDAEDEVPYRVKNNSPYLRYANENGEEGQYSGTDNNFKPKPGSIATFDVTGDGTTDVVYVNNNNSNQRLTYVNGTGGPVELVAENGKIESVSTNTGVASIEGPSGDTITIRARDSEAR